MSLAGHHIFNFFRLKMHKKSNLLFALGLSLLLITQTAHADFRKALDAYIARDGASMLAEVKDAVDKKNDDGLMLLLITVRIEGFQSTRKYFYYNDDNAKPSTLKTILTATQRQQMYDLLIEATNNSTAAERQALSAYYFFDDKDTLNRLNKIQSQNSIDKGDNLQPIYKMRIPNLEAYIIDDKKEWNPKIDWVKYQNDLMQSAKAGNPQAQLDLAHTYFGDSVCARHQALTCIERDEAKGINWLKAAIKTFEKNGRASFRYPYKTSVCEFFTQAGYKFTEAHSREKLLWCLIERSYPSPQNLIYQMGGDTKLKASVPEIFAVRMDMEKVASVVATGNLLPDMMKETRAELLNEDMPVFSYYVNDNLTYKIEIYSDGRVMIGFDEWPIPLWMDESKALLMKVPPQAINNFLSDLKKIGFDNMPIFGKSFDGCSPLGCAGGRTFEFTLANNKIFKRIYRTDLDQNVDFLNQDSAFNKEIAPIVVLVEKYFPTKKLRCEIGNSVNYKQACLERDNVWKSMAKVDKLSQFKGAITNVFSSNNKSK
jgi:TPR repeat protein